MTNLHLWSLNIWVSSRLTADRDCVVEKKKKDWTTIVVNLHPCRIYETQPKYSGQSVN